MKREIVRTEFIRKSELQEVELRFSSYRGHTFEKHTHDTYSIGIVTEGETEFSMHEKRWLIRGGDIALINPGEVHSCNPSEGSEMTYCMFYIEPELMREIAADLTGSIVSINPISSIGSSINLIGHIESGPELITAPLFDRPVVRDEKLFRQLQKLGVAIDSDRDPLEVESLLYESVAELIKKYCTFKDISESGEEEEEADIAKGMEYITDHLTENTTLQELSSHTGISPFHFLRRFRKKYGLPPHTFQLQERMNMAKRLLAEGVPIADVALEAGFADQSHFTRKFKSFTGATPRVYQQAKS